MYKSQVECENNQEVNMSRNSIDDYTKHVPNLDLDYCVNPVESNNGHCNKLFSLISGNKDCNNTVDLNKSIENSNSKSN